ncbi:MAG: GAF domain-containing protein [Planctomycetia bacterium]|nr:GAF domain-containing protein [Planctomycetia bacterium]
MAPESHFFDFVLSEKDYRFLDALAGAVASAGTPDLAIATGLREICIYGHWDFGQAWIPDATEQRLDPGPYWMADSRMQTYRDASISSPTKYGIGLLWGAFLNRRPVICLDFASEMTFRRKEGAEAAGLRGGIFVPIVEGPQTRGVAEFLSRAPRAEDARRGGFAMTAAGKLASAAVARRPRA